MVGEVIVGDNWAFFTVMVDILLLHPFVCVDIVINAPFDSFHEYIVQYRADIPSVSTFQVSRMGKVHKLKKKSFSVCFQVFKQLPPLKRCWSNWVTYFFTNLIFLL